MPVIDEDVLRELMHRSTDGLHAPPGVAAGIVTRRRRHRRRAQALGIAAAGVAAVTAVGLAASGVARPPADGHAGRAVHLPVIRLTAAQQALYKLSRAAGAATAPAGRYAVVTLTEDGVKTTRVIDSVTGDTWIYQLVGGVPKTWPEFAAGSPTQAQTDALPTDLTALRAALIAQARQDQATAIKDAIAALRVKEPKESAQQIARQAARQQAVQTADDMVFEQATDALWNPLVSPALRAAIYKILAATPGVVVHSGAHDSTGRPAIEISRLTSNGFDIPETFQDPRTGGVLETAFSYPAHPGQAKTQDGSDVYLSVTRTDTPPTANPYGG
ncbi:MAG TPA: hypothetical protein VGM79_22915 [Streptosporangiaceae bacterium]|jgi:hypothetical protein